MKKIALIIGANNYEHFIQLDCCENDATDISEILKNCGFDISLILNPTREELIESILEFKKDVVNNTISVIYFAGHGLQIGLDNFLVPVDAHITEDTDAKEVPYYCVHVAHLLNENKVDTNIVNIIILDACRDNKLKSGIHGIEGWLARMDSPLNTIIGYSTSANTNAIERPGERNGVYTRFLLNNIQIPNLSIEEVLKSTRTDVMNDTDNRQIPWEESSLHGKKFSFVNINQIEINLDKILLKWNKNQEIFMPELFLFLNDNDLKLLPAEKLQLLFSLTDIAFHKETNGLNQKTVDTDSFFSDRVDKYYPILGEKLIQENIFSDYELILEKIEIMPESNYGYNSIDYDPTEESFHHFMMNEVLFDSKIGILSFFIFAENNQHVINPILYLKNIDNIEIKNYGLIIGQEAENLLEKYIKIREPFEPPRNSFIDFSWDDESLF